MTQTFIQKFALLDPIGYYPVYRPWMQLDEYNAACDWLEKFKWEEAHWDFGSGMSNINNVQFPTRVYLRDTVDYLAFKLTFPNLLKF